jgi:spore coat protein JB
MNNKQALMRKVQEMNFGMIETGLFVDNQPCNQDALEAFEYFRNNYEQVKREYENNYGPLSYSGVKANCGGWSWIDGPWPWEGEE